MTKQIINPERQKKKRIMKEMEFKTGKQYRKYLKKLRKNEKNN